MGISPAFAFAGPSQAASVHAVEIDCKPNCFSVDRLGRAREGILLDLDPAINRGKPSLVLAGRRFIARDAFGGRGCDYVDEAGRGKILHASVGEFKTERGSFPLLRKPVGDSLLVHLDYGDAPHVLLNQDLEPLFAGYAGSARSVMHCVTEALVEIGKGEHLIVFYSNGAVAKFVYPDILADKRSGFSLDAALALNERLDNVRNRLKTAKDMQDSAASAVAEDRAMHELASILRMAKVFPEFKEKIVHTIESIFADGHEFRRAVLRHFRDVLVFLGDTTIYGWMAGEDDLIQTEAVPVAVLSPRQKDGRLHGFINDAVKNKHRSYWELAFRELVLASEQGELRPNVQIRFCTQCPPTMSDLSDQVSKLPTAVSQQGRKTSPLGNKTVLSRVESDKRRAANRADRHALQPKRGSSNGGGKNQAKGGGKRK